MATDNIITSSPVAQFSEGSSALKNTFADHGNEIAEIISKRPPWFVRWGTIFIFLLLLLIALICWFIKYPELVIARARLNNINNPSQVVSKTTGKLVKIAVKENEMVRSGQVLAFMESIAQPHAVLKLSSEIDSMNNIITEKRTDELYKFYPDYTKNQQTLNNLGELQSAYEAFIQSFTIFKDYLNSSSYQGKKIIQLENQIIIQKNAFAQALQTMKSQLQAWELRYLLKAPVEGKVFFTEFFQENQELKTGQSLFFIYPDSTSYFLEMLIPKYNFGQVKTGQDVLLKFQAYPHEQFGSVKGKIELISSMPTDSSFLAKVSLPNGLITSYKKEIPYEHGLVADAYIVTQDLRLLDRFYYNLKKQLLK